MAVLPVTDNSFEKEVIEQSKTKPVLVDFWATWCGPCKQLSPLVEQIANEHSDKLQVVKIDVDDNAAVSEKFGIMSIPTLILFKDGQKVHQMIGYQPKERIVGQLSKFL